MLYARIVSSTVPHARIKSIDTSAAEAYPGVQAVHILDRLLSIAQLRDPCVEANERYPLVRYHGQPIAAVAATSMRAAKAAAKLVRIEYERLPHVTSLEAAMQQDAPVVFPGPTEQAATAGGGGAAPGLPQKGNLRGPARGGLGGGPRGDVQQGFAQADHIVTREYRTQVQTHTPMETHGLVADWRDDELTLYASTQFALSVRDEAADVFELPKEKIRVISEFTGGGFGAKFGIGNYGALAIHLSRKARAPVRLVLDRREEHVSVGNRPSSLQRVKLGAKRDGTLTALQVESYGTGGVAAGAGVGFCHSAMYPIPNVQHRALRRVHRRRPVRRVSRARASAGHLRARAGARRAGARDSAWIRSRCARRSTRTTPTTRARARSSAASAPSARAGRSAVRRRRRRTGQARHRHGAIAVGLHRSRHDHAAKCGFAATARSLRSPARRTSAPARARSWRRPSRKSWDCASRTSMRASAIRATRPARPSGGSRVTSSITPAARNAAYLAARDLAARVAPSLDARPEEIVFQDGRVFVRGRPERGLTFVGGRARRRTSTRSCIAPTGARTTRATARSSATCTSASRHRRRAVRADRSRHRDRRRQGRARRRRPRLRPADQSEADRKPDLRRRDPGRQLRAVRGASSRSGAPACSSTPTSTSTRSSARARRRRSKCTSSSSSAPVFDRRARRRRAGERRDRGGDRQRVLQRDRQAHPHAAA